MNRRIPGILALALAVPLPALAQQYEPSTGRQYVVPVSPGGGTTNQTVQTVPGALTIIPLDAATVVTGGVAVTALTAGHASRGGFIFNPNSATVTLCVNQQGAAGTASAGATTCLEPGRSFALVPSAAAVSVNAADAAHGFAGEGLN